MERISDVLGWIGGAATVYGTVTLGAIASVWAAAWAVRTAAHLLVAVVAR